MEENKRRRSEKKSKKKDWWMHFSVPAEKLLDLVNGFRSSVSREKELLQFRELYIGADYQEQGRKEQVKWISVAIAIFSLTVVLAGAAELKSRTSRTLIQENCIYRGEDAQQVDLYWQAGDRTGNVAFELATQRVPIEERDALFQEAESYIRSYIQGGNDSLQKVQIGRAHV